MLLAWPANQLKAPVKLNFPMLLLATTNVSS